MAGKTLSVVPTIDPTASVRESKLGKYTEVGARTILLEVSMDDYSYVVNDSQITYRARYILDGAGKDAPLGATVTLELSAAADALRARRRDLERQLDLERDNALDTLDTALQAVATASARASAAEESFRIATRKRDAGSLPQIAFLDAERALTEARLGQAIARFEALDAAAELDRVLAHYPLPPDTRSAPARSTP